MSNDTTIEQKIYKWKQEYCKFMVISSFPEYRIEKFHYNPQKKN